MSRTIAGRRVAELSDAELREEAEARRRARRRGRGSGARRAEPRGERPEPHEVLQHYANLELEPGATMDEVQERYLDLLDRYDPDRQKDPAKREVAAELTEKLKVAYRGLKAYLQSR